MKRIIVSLITIGCLVGIVGYAAGVFTQEERAENSCTLCRAIRYDGKTYGFQYTRIEDSIFTPWYRENIDPGHGIDDSHPHSWQPSEGPKSAAVFMLRPESQLSVMRRIPDRLTQAAVLRAINSPNPAANIRRVRLLVEYTHVDARAGNWYGWWQKNAHAFGLGELRSEAAIP